MCCKHSSLDGGKPFHFPQAKGHGEFATICNKMIMPHLALATDRRVIPAYFRGVRRVGITVSILGDLLRDRK